MLKLAPWRKVRMRSSKGQGDDRGDKISKGDRCSSRSIIGVVLPELKSPTKGKEDVLKDVADSFPETKKERILQMKRAYCVPRKGGYKYSLLNVA